jgi:dihydroorotate dehydrogenase (NAD+) catalytic subunit
MTVKLGNLVFKNPLLLASGTFGFGDKFVEVVNKMGGIITKGITLKERVGNPLPRIYEVDSGVLNSVGLENPGLENFKKEILPRLSKLRTNLIINIQGATPQEFEILVQELSLPQIQGIEINLSCPNLRDQKQLLAQNPKLVYKITRHVRKRTDKFLIVKLTANFVDPLVTARAAQDAGADAISLINTLYGIAFNLKTKKPILGGISGGFSGPAIKPFALYCVYRVRQEVSLPIIGGGGVMSAHDVREYFCAGADLVAIGSANLVDPFLGIKILKELGEEI